MFLSMIGFVYSINLYLIYICLVTERKNIVENNIYHLKINSSVCFKK